MFKLIKLKVKIKNVFNYETLKAFFKLSVEILHLAQIKTNLHIYFKLN